VNQPAATATLELELARTRPRALYYLALTKPRVLTMILAATLTGFYLGSVGRLDLRLALSLIIGTAMAAGGTLALNQYLERDLDARMERTRTRPLPAGNLYPSEALWFGAALIVAGFAYLYFAVGVVATAVTAAITLSYLVAYTPLKRVSSLCTVVGAVPGALPPVAGWAAARGTLDPPAWVLFAIIYLWQLPHTLAIAQLYRADFQRAGIHLLATDDPDGGATARQMIINTLALMAVALLPALLHFAGLTYFVVAIALGLLMLGSTIQFASKPGAAAARRVLMASLIYLPLLLLVMVLDKS
jgi:protoheme IX farnesyltransferase